LGRLPTFVSASTNPALVMGAPALRADSVAAQRCPPAGAVAVVFL